MRALGIILLALPLLAETQVKPIATQAVLTYDAPTGAACIVDIHETALEYAVGTISTSGANVTGSGTAWTASKTGQSMNLANILYVFTYISATTGTLSPAPPTQSAGTAYKLYPLAHDVDSALFAGSNLDSRSTGTSVGTRRVFVAGKQVAEKALNSKFYSRALRAFTQHSYNLCSTITGTFWTDNPPAGLTYAEPPPVDPLNPGSYAVPTYSETDPDEIVIDPVSGLPTKLVYRARDAWLSYGSGTFGTTVPAATGWTTPDNLRGDDAATADYGAAGPGTWAFIPFDVGGNASLDVSAAFLTILNPSFNVWASSASSIDVALTLDRSTVASDIINHAVASCSSSCTAGNRFALFTSPQPMLADWFASNGGISKIAQSDFAARGGAFSRSGADVTNTGGDAFYLGWNANSKITLNSVEYGIAAVLDDVHLTLATNPGGTDGGGWFSRNSGFLVRKATATGETLHLQYMSYYAEQGIGASLGPSADSDALASCSTVVTTDAATGHIGELCILSFSVFWHDRINGKVIRLGRAKSPDGGGVWGTSIQNGYYFDSVDGNTFYGQQVDVGGNTVVMKFVFSPLAGAYTDMGDWGGLNPVTACGSAPCWTVTKHSSVGIAAAIQAFHPTAWNATQFQSIGDINLGGKMGDSNRLVFRVLRHGTNDEQCFYAVYDIATATVVAAYPVWATPGSSYSACHGITNMNNPDWVLIAATNFRGPATGRESVAGNGPYMTPIVGSVSGSGTLCPTRPPNSPVPVSEWPTGNLCADFVTGGQPGDPTPLYLADGDNTFNSDGSFAGAAGTITSVGTAVTLSAGAWNTSYNGFLLRKGSEYRTFTYVDSTHGTLSSGFTVNASGSSFRLYKEQVNDPSINSPDWASMGLKYKPGDLACITYDATTGNCGGQYYPNNGYKEITKILIVTDDTHVTVARGFAGGSNSPHGVTALSSGSGANLGMMQQSCEFGAVFNCAETSVYWNATLDPFGLNATGATVVKDSSVVSCCHATTYGNTAVKSANVPDTRDGVSAAYYARYGTYPGVLSATGYLVASAPPFHGKIGMGYPNPVDIHPGHGQSKATAGDDKVVYDARPMLGDDLIGSLTNSIFGTVASPGTLVSGQLWKWTAAQQGRSRPRILAQFAFCGVNPLKDVSSGTQGNTIATDSSSAYTYCTANAAGECQSTSNPGDTFVNCPQIGVAFCSYPGIGGSAYDARDVCVADMGAYTYASVAEIGIAAADPDGANGRVITRANRAKGFTFQNTIVTPHRDFAFAWVPGVNGLRTSIIGVQLPPLRAPDAMAGNDYVSHLVSIPTVAGATTAYIKFGYNPSLYCRSRADICVANTTAIPDATPFAYLSEAPAGLACSSNPGCKIAIPVIRQRIFYYQVIHLSAGGAIVKTDPMEIRATR